MKQIVENKTCIQYLIDLIKKGWNIKEINYPICKLEFNNRIKEVNITNDFLTLRPNAAGDLTQWDPNGATNNWECVDEEEPDFDTTYVEGGSLIGGAPPFYLMIKIGGKLYYSDNKSLTTSYQSFSYVWEDNPYTQNSWTWNDINNLQIGIRADGDFVSDRDLYNIPNPSQSGSIDQIEVFAVAKSYTEVKSATGSARCTQVYVEITYTPAPPTPAKKPSIPHLDKGPHPRSRAGYLGNLKLGL